jgi:hypothetical protein
MKKYYLSFHTVFTLNENIKWLEEFIIYYKHIGFTHFYLYHNEGSSGCCGSERQNKYGFPINTTSNDEDKQLLSKILLKYKDDITYILWQPKKNDIIVYGQNESVMDCITKYGCDNEWIAFFDLDEFIYSEKNIDLPCYLKSLDRNISCVKLIQKKFIDRFLSNGNLITQDFRCINNLVIDTHWGAKNIVRCEDCISTEIIHYFNVKYNTITPDVDILRFNHYNLNNKQLNWMKSYFNSDSEFKIDGIDDGMKRYNNIFNFI